MGELFDNIKGEKEMGLAYTVAQDKIAIIEKYVLRFRGVINH